MLNAEAGIDIDPEQIKRMLEPAGKLAKPDATMLHRVAQAFVGGPMKDEAKLEHQWLAIGDQLATASQLFNKAAVNIVKVVAGFKYLLEKWGAGALELSPGGGGARTRTSTSSSLPVKHHLTVSQ
jgi:hypothetical protein